MSLPVTVYRWDDAGAPQLTNGKPSEIIAILKKCLVEGYGTKAGAGWSVAFENAAAFKIAFRNSTFDGSGGFVQFWAPNGTDVQSTGLRFRGAKSMTGLDLFIDPQIQMQLGNSATSSYWVILATSTAFWFFTTSSLTTPYTGTIDHISFFVGDIDSTAINDPGRFVNIMAAAQADITSVSYGNTFNMSISPNNYVCKIYDTDGSNNSLIYRFDVHYMQGSTGLAGLPASDRVFFKPKIYNSAAISNNDRLGVNVGRSVVQPFFRGTIPGLLNTPQGGYSDQAWPTVETINGKQHMLMPGYFFGRNWIDMESWYD